MCKASCFFVDGTKTIKHDIDDVLGWYDQGRKEDARARKANKASENGIQVSRAFSR